MVGCNETWLTLIHQAEHGSMSTTFYTDALAKCRSACSSAYSNPDANVGALRDCWDMKVKCEQSMIFIIQGLDESSRCGCQGCPPFGDVTCPF
jgi:hypothetical protein